MRPITLRNQNLHKGPSSSKEFNSLRNDIHTDITTLFDIVNENEKIISSNMDHVLRENFFLQNRLHLLETKIKELEVKYNAESPVDSIMKRSFYQASNVNPSDSTKPIYLDSLHGIVSPVPVKNVNKIYYTNSNGKHLLPSSFNAQVSETTDIEPLDEESKQRRYYSIQNEDFTNVFDGDKNSFWIRQSSFPEDKCVTEVYSNISFNIPTDISNNVYTNTLILHPSPEYSMSLLDIQYLSSSGEWRRLETYPTVVTEDGEVPKEIKEFGRIVFSFPRKEIKEIQIKIKQPYWFKNNDNRVFVYGFQDIIVEYNEYAHDEAEFVTEFSLEDTNYRFASVSLPTVTVPEGCIKNIQDLVDHELYFDRGLTEQFEFSTEIYQPIQKVYVKTILKSSAGYTPMLQGIELPYQAEEMDS